MVGRLKQTEEVLNQKLVEKQEEPLEKEHEYIFSEKDKQELEVLLREFLT